MSCGFDACSPTLERMPALGQGLPFRLCWQHVRCTQDSCRPYRADQLDSLGPVPDIPYDTAGAATLEFERGILNCDSNCVAVGNFQPNSPTAMTASVRFDTFNALSIAVT
jgi:hypothetical protein